MRVLLVDGRNVQRSCWPNVPDEELVAQVEAWLGGSGYDRAEVVFDGRASSAAHDRAVDGLVAVVDCAGSSADDWLVERATGAVGLEEVAVVTSDRALRERLAGVARIHAGGGGFLGELGLRRR